MPAVQGRHTGACGWFTDPPASYTQKHTPPTGIDGLAQISAFSFYFYFLRSLNKEEETFSTASKCGEKNHVLVIEMINNPDRENWILYSLYNSAHCFSHLLIIITKTAPIRNIIKSESWQLSLFLKSVLRKLLVMFCLQRTKGPFAPAGETLPETFQGAVWGSAENRAGLQPLLHRLVKVAVINLGLHRIC